MAEGTGLENRHTGEPGIVSSNLTLSVAPGGAATISPRRFLFPPFQPYLRGKCLRERLFPQIMALLKGTLDVLVLKTLSWGPMHGFEITRWLENRSDSPWYPSMRIFRQQKLGDWPEVFDRVAAALAELAAANA